MSMCINQSLKILIAPNQSNGAPTVKLMNFKKIAHTIHIYTQFSIFNINPNKINPSKIVKKP